MKSSLSRMYQKLFAYFGRQYWWPAESAFEVMVGAILAQNTSWLNVCKAIKNLKSKNLLSPDKLYGLADEELAELIRPAGYYNLKARRLKEFLRFLRFECGGDISRLRRKQPALLRHRLLMVNGIGPETADSILLYALNKPVFVVDAYTKRILIRHNLISAKDHYQQVQDLFMQELSHSNGVDKSYRKDISNVVKLFNEFHALIVRVAKEFCFKSNPRCRECPLNEKNKD
jgi:endonuclease-3 related protein